MAKNKYVTPPKEKPKEKPKDKKKGGKKRGAVAEIVRILSLNGIGPNDGAVVSRITGANPPLRIVGFQKPANQDIDVQLFQQGGSGVVLASPRRVTASNFRWEVTFDSSEVGAAGSGFKQFLLEANLVESGSPTGISAFVAFTLQG